MVNAKIISIFLCTLFLVVNTITVDILRTTDRRYYRLVPPAKQALPLRRIVRDIFADSGERVPPEMIETTGEQNPKQDASSFESNAKEVTTQKNEILKPVYYDSTALFKKSHRNRRAYERYADKDDYYYDDNNYAGYDRKGSAVGYMDRDDDFPTVVW